MKEITISEARKIILDRIDEDKIPEQDLLTRSLDAMRTIHGFTDPRSYHSAFNELMKEGCIVKVKPSYTSITEVGKKERGD